MHRKLFISKVKSEKYDNKIFIMEYSDMPHMAKLEDIMKNIQDSEKQVRVGDSGKINGMKCGYWNIYQKHYGKTHHMILTGTDIIPGIHEKYLSLHKQ